MKGFFQRLVGKKGIKGYKDGDFESSLFNQPDSAVYFRKNFYDAQLEKKYKVPIILNSISSSCLYVNESNYTSCQSSYSYTENGINDDISNTVPNLSYIKDIYIIPSGAKLPDDGEYDQQVIFISDKNNHCIRKINLETQITETVAGQCEISGFKDGPLGINLLNFPTSIGVDPAGNIFFYDSGNNYIRMLDTNGYINTLIKGSCRGHKEKIL
ncbi:hypothetical protein PPERSA_02902 [Pseudocohnilembus persalinus]|uniref:Six-bladed beta-propeller, TolB-like n=1 Tax=Pseudocohnilembus persalinus TaxID=266149 RepID=A0A0V0QMG5_PSEPJ|nr:hypothetical protein PPERSA_02902 [Pseudocohnilembus persalinus]|eukprot:KRX03523.1 hypothetical protein PPERSA_02902 [Pseudocohnilembus persalinus]